MKWLQENWLQLHLALAPLGTLIVTWLIWLFGGDGWQWWSNRDNAAQMGQIVPLGAVVYGSLIFAIERLGRMFWALAQREKDIEKGRQAGRAEGREAGRAEGRQAGREEGREELIRELLNQEVELPPEILKELENLDRKSRKQ